MATAAFNKQKALFTRQLGINQREELLNCIVLYGAENWALRKVYLKYLKRCEMCFLEKNGKNSWTVKSEELLHSQGIQKYPSYYTKKEG
jgi:hypothetical protein